MTLERASAWAGAGVLGLALLHVAVYVGVVVARIAYPFELEWLEGLMLTHVERVLAGEPVYVEPSLDFVAHLYLPLYYWSAALVASMLGEGFVALRLVSFLASLGCALLLYALVRLESGERLPAAVAGAFYLATFEVCGGYFDLGRVDSLFVMSLLAAAVALRARPDRAGAALAGLLLAASFLIKQSALIAAAPVALYLVLYERSLALPALGAASVAIAVSVLVLDWSHDGWFLYYTVVVPRGHPTELVRFARFWTHDMLQPLGVATALALGICAARLRAGASHFPLFFGAGLIVTAWAMRGLVGGHTNDLMPAAAGLALFVGLALADAKRAELRLAVSVLVALQLVLLAYDPRAHVPSADDRRAGEALVARLAAVEGEVFVPNHGYLAKRAGKRGYAHTMAIDNLLLDDFSEPRRALEMDFGRHFAEGRFAVVVIDSDGRYEEWARRYFGEPVPAIESETVFWPVAGNHIRPQYWYEAER